MKIITTSAIICLATVTGFAQTRSKAKSKTKPAATITTIRTAQDSLSYAFALNIIKEMKDRDIKTLNYAVLNQAIKDGAAGKENLLTPEQAKATIGKNLKTKYKQNALDGQAFLAANKTKPGVITTPSGLQYQIVQQGTGPLAKMTDTVSMHYRGTFINGKQFDSSYDRNQPLVGPPSYYIKGWQEGLLLMNQGAKFRFFIPYNLAYGDREMGADMPVYSTLIFDVEMVKIGK